MSASPTPIAPGMRRASIVRAASVRTSTTIGRGSAGSGSAEGDGRPSWSKSARRSPTVATPTSDCGAESSARATKAAC